MNSVMCINLILIYILHIRELNGLSMARAVPIMVCVP